jgi:hypothetical protein
VLAWKSISTDSILVFGILFSLQESGDGISWNCVSVESQSGVKGGWRVGEKIRLWKSRLPEN